MWMQKLFSCSDGWPSHSNGQCASESATSPHVGLGYWLSESSSLLPLPKVRRVFHQTSRASESRDHSLTAASMVDENKHNSDQTAKGPWCFLDRRQSDEGSDLPPFFCYEKHWSISENIPIVVGTIPLLACILVLSGKKSTRRRARLRFSHSDTNWSRKKGTFERKMFFSRHFEASPCNKSVIALVAR